jgi:hypothetical protein
LSEPLEGVLEPWSKKIEIELEGTRLLVPENQDLIRIFQYLGLKGCLQFFPGTYCWNATCNNCICTFTNPTTGETMTQKACQTRVVEGLSVVRLPKDVRKT